MGTNVILEPSVSTSSPKLSQLLDQDAIERRAHPGRVLSWFAAQPSGTGNVCKIYAESFRNEAHLDYIVDEARTMVNRALTSVEERP